MARRSDKGRLPPFVPLLRATLGSRAWMALSHGARSLYVALRCRVPNGRNQAYLSYRHAERELGSSRRKIGEWFKELEHYGFIVLAAHGCLGVEGKGKAPLWRLTELGATSKASSNGAFEPPTNDFLKWSGVLFERRREARTPGSYGCKKQKPGSYVGNGVFPTSEPRLAPTSETLSRDTVSDGVAIERPPTVSDGVAITSLTTRVVRAGSLSDQEAASYQPRRNGRG